MLDLTFAEKTHTGSVRENNEDALGHFAPRTAAEAQSHGWLFVLADGMGGHEAGEVASALAVKTAVEGYSKMPMGVMHVSILPKLVQEANAAVLEAAHKRKAQRGMGTTIVCVAVRFDSAVVSHVGDSRCYLFRSGRLSPLTHDHTMAADQVRLGLMSREEAEAGEGRHVLTRALGSELFVAADTITVNVLPGDRLVLCSDGLHGFVDEFEMQRVLQANTSAEAAAQALVDAALAAGGQDNVSVQVVAIRSVERMGLYRGRPYRLL